MTCLSNINWVPCYLHCFSVLFCFYYTHKLSTTVTVFEKIHVLDEWHFMHNAILVCHSNWNQLASGNPKQKVKSWKTIFSNPIQNTLYMLLIKRLTVSMKDVCWAVSKQQRVVHYWPYSNQIGPSLSQKLIDLCGKICSKLLGVII